MSQLFTGSICLTDLIEKAKKQHSSFQKAGNNKIYCNIKIWVNDEEDKFGNIVSLQLNSTKEMRESEGVVYIGNAKKAEAKQPQPISPSDVSDISADDLPF